MTKLDAIKARAEKATEGPWIADTDEPSAIRASYYEISSEAYRGESLKVATSEGKENAEFLAAARADIPALLRVVEAAQGIIPHLPTKEFMAQAEEDGRGDLTVECRRFYEAIEALNQPETEGKQ